ncbi:lipase-like [Dendronephthya gigantea]|uniref:lipase-like n=1 Tax=Dendronephthya gigantea TaxID=151771 RepID=UPI00106C5131|nr:lipase-like [Dendronephthya gigantea]
MSAMFRILVLTIFIDAIASNSVYPPTKVIQLSLGVSKAAYLPLPTRRFIKNGAIIENISTMMPRRPFPLIYLPPKYDPAQDKEACSITGWKAEAYENRETEVLKFTHDEQKIVVFGFRGTEPFSVTDWLGNFNLQPGAFEINGTPVSIHKGFVKRYGYISSWFENEYMKVPADYSIVLTGHSLGGAEATVAAAFVAERLNRRPDAVVTFGSPYPGLLSFKKYYNKAVGCDRTVRMTAKCDPFTKVPMTVRGYLHVCDGVEVNGRTGISFIRAHILYEGYERGIKRKYTNIKEVSFGCD